MAKDLDFAVGQDEAVDRVAAHVGLDASSKASPAVSKLLKVWETRQAQQAARVSGLGLMAVSLAACGGSDTTPFSQTDIDSATAPLNASITTLTATLATRTSERDAAATARDAAVTQRDALQAQITVINGKIEDAGHDDVDALIAQRDTLTTDLASANETIVARDATIVARNAEITTLTTNLATMTAARDALVTDLAAANATIVARDGTITTVTAARDAVQAALDALNAELAAAGFTDLTDLVSAYTALIDPVATAFTTAVDALTGRAGNDTFTASAGTVAAADSVVDTSTTDSDTINVTSSGTVAAFRATNIENINVTINSLSNTDAVDAANFSGVNNLTVTRGDVTVGGATLTGNKAVRIDNVDASQIASISVGAGTTTVDINSAATDGAGHVLNLNSATGAVTVDGAATINAALATSVAIDAVSNTTAAETAKATTINAAVATTVTTHADLTGSITINAAAATSVTVNDAQGGVTINAGAATTGVVVVDVDASGAIITVGTGTTAAPNVVTIDGTDLTTDAASISGAGVVTLDIDGTNAGNVDILTLSGNGAAVTYNVTTPNTGTAASFTKGGSQSVTLAGNEAVFAGATVAGVDVLDLNAGTAGTIAASLWSATKVDLGFDNQNNAITVSNGQAWEITADQTTGLNYNFSTTTIGDLTVIAGDDNGDNTAVGTITVGAFDATAGAATTTGTVTIEASIANFTATGATIGAAQSLVITGDEDVTLGTVTVTGATAATNATVNGANSTGIISLTADVAIATVTTGSGADVVILNDASGPAVTAHTLSTNAGNDNITITATAATATIDAGAGNDAIAVDALTAIVVAGGDGNDTFTTGGDIEAILLGGNGTDRLVLTADVNFANNTQFALNSVEEISLSGANIAMTISAAQLAANPTISIIGDAADDTLTVNSTATGSIDGSGISIATGSTATINYVGSTGANTITGGAEDETIQGGAGADSIEGGDGTDTFVLEGVTTETGSTNPSTGMIVNLSSSSISAATIVSNVAGTYLGGSATTVAANTATHLYDEVASGNASVVDSLSSIENITGGAGADYIVGSASNNVLFGGDGADYISGGDGDDVIGGSAGDDVDTKIGGAGNDTYVISDQGEADVIVEAASGGTDTILFSDALSLAGVAFGTTVAGASANAALAQIEQIVVDTDTTATFSSAQLSGQTIAFNALAAGTVTIAVTATNAAAVNTINLGSLTTTAFSYLGADGNTATGIALDANDIVTIAGGSDIDTITAMAGVSNTITGGAGNDVITLGSGVDTLVFASTAAGNGADTVAGFTAGAGGDVLNFDAFLGTSAAFLDEGSTTISAAIGATNAGAEATGTSISGKVILVDVDTIADTTALAALISADDDGGAAAAEIDDKLLLTDGQKAVVLLGDVNGTGTGNYLVYYVVGTDTTTDDSETITLVGTLSSVDLDALVATNLF